MNLKLLCKVLGLLLALESLALVACACFAVYDDGLNSDASISLFSAGGAALLIGFSMVYLGRGSFDRVPRREGVMIVGFAWIISGVIGAVPFVLASPGLTWAGAFFESISGLTTTGSTVMTDLNEWPRAILLWRAVSQFLGGLGILVLFVALLATLGAGTKSLFRNESSFQASEVSHARIQDTAILLWKVYCGLVVVCAIGLKVLGMNWLDSVSHAMTAVSTGGFSTRNESIAYYSGWQTGLAIELWLVLFMILGSLSFLMYVVLMRRNWERVRREEEGRWYLIFIVLAVASIVVLKWGLEGETTGESVRGALFTVVSIISSTGFGTVDFDLWPVSTHFILLGLMLLGGCAGSTAGGMKVSRLLLLIRSARQEIVQAFRPNQILRMQVNGNSIDDRGRAQTILFVALFFLIALFSMLVVSVLEARHGMDFETLVSSVLATLGNTGPGFGEVGPTKNFASLREGTQVYLALLMVLGRLELFAFLVLFVPSAWRKF